jgi:hypothetical protein
MVSTYILFKNNSPLFYTTKRHHAKKLMYKEFIKIQSIYMSTGNIYRNRINSNKNIITYLPFNIINPISNDICSLEIVKIKS